MTEWAGVVARLFAMPGQPDAVARPILRRAAAAHEMLLVRARTTIDRDHRKMLSMLLALLPRSDALKRRLLCQSVLVEGLHCLAPLCPTLKEWHQCTASPSILDEPNADAPVGRMILGNTILALLLRADHLWCGRMMLSSDRFGQIRFPMCDWSLALGAATDPPSVRAGEPVTLQLDSRQARWSWNGRDREPFLIMPRAGCVKMIVANLNSLQSRDIIAPDPQTRPRLQCSAPLCTAGARYAPVQFLDWQAHSAVCGGIVKLLHDGLREHSPPIHREFCRLMETIQGFELPNSQSGIVQSFSDATRPGVMGFNVPFTEAHEPRLCPFCFTWPGHEMAHTKCYFICSIVWRHGGTFLQNGEESTETLTRYRRPLSLRTLFQVPYTHLYEWVLLMDFLDARFRAVPWEIDADPIDFGFQLRAEIVEAFDELSASADLTSCGKAAVSHFWNLFKLADRRWKRCPSALNTRQF